MSAVLAIDQGTTGSTALVVGGDGRVLGRAYREIPQYFPAPGEVEHDPEEILRLTVDAAREAVERARVVPLALGITNQRETVCAWERDTGRPVHRAIVWQDRRTTPRCRELTEGRMAPMIQQRTGLLVDPYFSATKIEWLLEHVPGLDRRVHAGEVVFGTIDTWLMFRLTNGETYLTDHTNASRTMLYDINRRGWDDELLHLFSVPRAALPEIRASAAAFGVARPEHFGVELPITGVAGDQQAALYGQGCWNPGQAKNTYGTGAFLLLNTGNERGEATEGMLCTVACGSRGEPVYAFEGSVFIAGAAIQWLRDGLGLLEHAGLSEQMARDIADTGGVYFVPAFVGLGAPHWEPHARGTIVGLTRGTGRAQLVRAALEAMAYSTKEILDAMTATSRVRLAALQVDGGGAANDWLMQFQADLLGVPVARPDVVETTALGAAALAGLGAGVWREPEEFLRGRTYHRFLPDAGAAAAQAGLAGWLRAVETALHWARTAE